MVKSTLQINNFTTGQISPKMWGRSDLSFYNASNRKQLNFISDVEGPATYRKGSTYLGTTHNNKLAYLYKFVFAKDESYILEFTDLALRFWSEDADGNYGLVEETGTGNPLVLVTPFTEEHIRNLHTAQTADTMYIVNNNYQPQKLVRTGANVFTLTPHAPTGLDLTLQVNFPSSITIFQARLIYAGTNSNPQKIYFSRNFNYDDFGIGTNDADPFNYTIGSDEANPIYSISSLTDTLVIGTLGGLFDGTSNGSDKNVTPTNFRISSTSSKGVNTLRMLRRDNIVLYLQSGAKIINSYGYSEDVNGNTPIDRSIFAENITSSAVSHMTFVNGRPDNLYCTLNNGKIALLVWKPEQRVFGWNDLQTDGKFISVASLPREIGDERVFWSTQREIEGQTNNYIEIVADNYELLQQDSFYTNNKDEDGKAWRNYLVEAQKEYIHVDCSTTYNGLNVGSNADITITAASGISVRTTSTADLFTSDFVGDGYGKSKEIREIGNNGRAEVMEYVSPREVNIKILVPFKSLTLEAGSYYITTNKLTGLDYLEGKTVSICADGSDKASRVVTGGVVDLDSQFTVIHLGLGIKGVIVTNNLDSGNPAGSAQFSKKNVTKCNINFLNTLGCSYGTDLYQLDAILFQNTSNQYGHAPVPFTGQKEVKGFEKTDNIKTLKFVKNDPTPCTILQVVSELETY